mmetsp:Transcript_126102/g.251816  ORF Transcript_126102/g.251816 Transcript_126102/m.251816 type:complete len:104 (-) Transcript_126102:317-628(-)
MRRLAFHVLQACPALGLHAIEARNYSFGSAREGAPVLPLERQAAFSHSWGHKNDSQRLPRTAMKAKDLQGRRGLGVPQLRKSAAATQCSAVYQVDLGGRLQSR